MKRKDCCLKTAKSDNQNSQIHESETQKELKEKNSNSACFCKETKKYHHIHSLTCGHPYIIHEDHVDYIVDGYLHFPHGGHCDNHGKIYFK